MKGPSTDHCSAEKRMLRYLKFSKSFHELIFHATTFIFELLGESDADWSFDVKDRQSTTGYDFKLGQK